MALRGSREGNIIRFMIELIDGNGDVIEVDALFDTGFTSGVLAIHRDDIEALGWDVIRRNIQLPTASSIGRFDLYEGTISIDQKSTGYKPPDSSVERKKCFPDFLAPRFIDGVILLTSDF